MTSEEYVSSYNGVALEKWYDIASIVDEDGDSIGRIASEEDAQNLIKALQKAIELGWFKE